jgi:RHS repeat-associated protein
VGHSTHYQYDNAGQLSQITHADGTTEQFHYDVEGNLIRHQDGMGHLTRYHYNGHNLPIERIDANGQRLQYEYDNALRLIALINAKQETYRFTYHPQGWLASETGFDGKTTEYQYDQVGQLIGQRCGEQSITLMRDANGQLLAKTTPETTVRYAHDAMGRLVAVASPHAEQRMHFDAVGQLIEERVHLNLPEPSAAFAPLPASARTSTHAATHVAAHVPEPAMRRIGYSLTHEYDELGNRIRSVLPNGRSLSTLRYGSGHWHGTLWQGNSLIDIERDALHRETLRQMGPNLHSESAYDAQSRLKSFHFTRQQKNHSPQRQSRHYQYDRAGQLTEILDSVRGNLHYRYDPLGQLLSALQPGLHETFAFDPAGNLLDPDQRQAGDGSISGTTSTTSTSSDQAQPPGALPNLTGNLLRQFQGNQYQYDQQGNLIKRHAPQPRNGDQTGKLDLTWDADNALTSAKRTWPNRREFAEYYYDAFQRRIGKRVVEEVLDLATKKAVSRKTKTLFFVWDGNTLLQEIEVGDGGAPAREGASAKTTTYLMEPDSFVPLAKIESSEQEEIYAPGTVYLPEVERWELPGTRRDARGHVRAYEAHEGEQRHAALRAQRAQEAARNAGGDRIHYYQVDHLGTPLELVDAEGNTAWAAKYMAWGRVWQVEVEQEKQPLRFQGQYFDEESGLHYNRYRYYDPELGRFVGQDPAGLKGGINLYRYSYNPTMWIDPYGLAPIQPPIISPGDITDKTRTEIRALACKIGLIPKKTDSNGEPIKWVCPSTGKERLRLDRGHIDAQTGKPYNDPKAATDHVHGYDPTGKVKIVSPSDSNPHFPTTGE